MKTGAPHWSPTHKDGEVGTLEQALLHKDLDSYLFLFMRYNGVIYMGSMYFDDIGFCDEVDTILKGNVGRSIKEIGDFDVSSAVRNFSFSPIFLIIRLPGDRRWINSDCVGLGIVTDRVNAEIPLR
jgi:hypothetical protein